MCNVETDEKNYFHGDVLSPQNFSWKLGYRQNLNEVFTKSSHIFAILPSKMIFLTQKSPM